MEIERALDIGPLLKDSSLFLLGPRGCGKSTYLKQTLSPDRAHFIDLLRTEDYLRLEQNPSLLEGIVEEAGKSIVVIDEIQTIPALLNEVHRLIEKNKKQRFVLTGSSARKIKKEQGNLLAGRAWMQRVFPFVSQEIRGKIKFEDQLLWGTIPKIYSSANKLETLSAYTQSYLREEIQQEGLTRRLAPFARFLEVAALQSGEMLNYSQTASDVGNLSAVTIREYYQILEDTLLGFALNPFFKTKKRKAIMTPKFYLFDTGVVNFMAGSRTLDRNSERYGKLLEHFFLNELRAFNDYRRKHSEITYWRSVNKNEVDFIFGNEFAVELKSSKKTTLRDAAHLLALKEEKLVRDFYVISNDPLARKESGISFLPIHLFLDRLWGGQIV